MYRVYCCATRMLGRVFTHSINYHSISRYTLLSIHSAPIFRLWSRFNISTLYRLLFSANGTTFILIELHERKWKKCVRDYRAVCFLICISENFESLFDIFSGNLCNFFSKYNIWGKKARKIYRKSVIMFSQLVFASSYNVSIPLYFLVFPRIVFLKP